MDLLCGVFQIDCVAQTLACKQQLRSRQVVPASAADALRRSYTSVSTSATRVEFELEYQHLPADVQEVLRSWDVDDSGTVRAVLSRAQRAAPFESRTGGSHLHALRVRE